MSLTRSLASRIASSRVFAASPIASTSASFSTTAPSAESKARRKSRLVRKTHLEAKASIGRAFLASKPDSVTGRSKANGALWDASLLKSVLLNRDEIWGKIVQPEAVEVEAGGDAAASTSTSSPSPAVYIPKRLNFGLSASDATALLTILPGVSALRTALDGPQAFDQARMDRAAAEEVKENDKRDKLARIIDLRNADSKGIRVENTRRIVSTFAVKGAADTGSPEVQAAIITSRIHALTEHCSNQPRDITNRRPLRQLVQQRAKILKYLRRLDVTRYEDCLTKIGVEARAVQGEVIVTKAELRALIAQ